MEIERGRAEAVQQNVQLLQPGTLGGKTQFLLDMSGVPRYNRIRLKLANRNFVTHARVEGQDDAHGKRWAVLGTTTLYDLSNEKLGNNTTLQIPLTTYKYLRVTIDNPVKPSDVEGATAGIISEQKAAWQDLSSKPKETQEGKNTVFTFLVPKNAPVDRVTFSIDQAQQGFDRTVEIRDDKGHYIGSGELSRIHLQRNGQKIDVERTFVNLPGTNEGTLRVIIHNGDDVPLKISDARLQQYERRIYFDSRPHSSRFITATKSSRRRSTITPNFSAKMREPAALRWARKKPTPAIPGAPTTGHGQNVIRLCCGWPSSRPSSSWVALPCAR